MKLGNKNFFTKNFFIKHNFEAHEIQKKMNDQSPSLTYSTTLFSLTHSSFLTENPIPTYSGYLNHSPSFSHGLVWQSCDNVAKVCDISAV